MNTIQRIQDWHAAARPNPTDADFNVQLGCHFEEIMEMVESLMFHSESFGTTDGVKTSLHEALLIASSCLKEGAFTVTITDRKAFLDSLADQVVTGVGVGHCAKMDVVKATDEVNRSNWSKFDPATGKPIFNEQGKIAKGPAYTPPNLEGLY